MILTHIFGQNIKESELCQSFINIKDPTRYIASLLSHYLKNNIGQFWNDVICEQPLIDKKKLWQSKYNEVSMVSYVTNVAGIHKAGIDISCIFLKTHFRTVYTYLCQRKNLDWKQFKINYTSVIACCLTFVTWIGNKWTVVCNIFSNIVYTLLLSKCLVLM